MRCAVFKSKPGHGHLSVEAEIDQSHLAVNIAGMAHPYSRCFNSINGGKPIESVPTGGQIRTLPGTAHLEQCIPTSKSSSMRPWLQGSTSLDLSP